jgi:hypothetical protein
MYDLRTMEYTALIDLLAQETLNFTNLLSEGCSEEEYNKITLTIRSLQAEIESRKRTSSNTDSTDPGILFPDK